LLNSSSNANSSSPLATGFTSSSISYADALENYRKNTDWWIVFDSFDLNGAKGSALWIASKTSLGVETVTEALEGLTVLGLLVKSSKGFEKVKANINLPNEGQTKHQKIHDHAMISRQILNHLGDDSRGALRHTCFASNIDIITDLYSKIDLAILEAQEKSRALDKSAIDNVYLATYTAVNTVPMSNDGKGDSHD
jgi:hypothetical protein